MLIFDALGLSNVLIGLFLEIDSLVYAILSYMFQVYMYIASAEVFTEATFKEIAERAYIVIGVVALFLVAFSLLQAIINPDNMKGKNSPVKVIQNVLISIVLLGVTPMIFDFAYELQNRVINSGILQKLILGGNTVTGQMVDCETSKERDRLTLLSETHPELVNNTEDIDLEYLGASMSVGMFSSFFYGVGSSGTDYYGFNIEPKSFEIWDILDLPTALIGTVFDGIRNILFGDGEDPHTLCETYEAVKMTGNFTFFKDYVGNASEVQDPAKVQYTYFISTLFGGYAIYMLLSFCIGLAVRAFKLGFYQIIAPIPILSRVVPQGKKVFDNWVKNTLSTFAEVFIRLVIIFFAIFMINLIVTKAPYEIITANIPFNLINPGNVFMNTAALTGVTIRVYLLGRALLILGVLIFANKAIKIVTDLFGIKSGSFKLGIKDQIKEAMFIGKPLAKGMDKAQGFITGAAGAGFSALKGKITGRGPVVSIGQSLLTGGIGGAGKGGNQFGSQRDAEFKRQTGKEGPDTIWGNFDRWSKDRTKTANKNAREAHKNYIKDVESSDAWKEEYNEIRDRILEQAPLQAEITANVEKIKDAFIEKEVNAEKERQREAFHMDEKLEAEKAKNNELVKNAMGDSRFSNIVDSIAERNRKYNINGMSHDDILKEALKIYGETSNDEEVRRRMPLALDENLLKQSLEDSFEKTFDSAPVKDKASKLFDAEHLKDTTESVKEQYVAEHKDISDAITKQITDEFKASDELYKQAKGVVGDWETAERQKDFRAVVEKMMKDEKEKNGGGTPPPKDDKK